MSKAIGIDIVEFKQMKSKLSEKFINRILSKNEQSKYNSITNEQRKLEYISGRFAAKEAYTKVYKKFDEPLDFIDVEILSDDFGAPFIISKYRPDDNIMISISHSENYVVAVCIKE